MAEAEDTAAFLIVNAGSSSLKMALLNADEQLLASGTCEGLGRSDAILRVRLADDQSREMANGGGESEIAFGKLADQILSVLPGGRNSIRGVAHRIVHGGEVFRGGTRITDSVRQEIERLSPLAPLHNPVQLELIRIAEQALPDVPHFATFDTAFFSGLPSDRYVLPLPYQWLEQYGIRRYGFHGLSHDYCSSRAASLLSPADTSRLVICHLGNGCSASAIRDGKPLTNTMGFTPLDGLMMGTRPGSLDPGVLPFLKRNGELSDEQIEDALYHHSGLKGVSGVSSDLREIEAAADDGNDRATLALRLFTRRVSETVGSLYVSLSGLDALVFTGGVGENSASVRKTVCDELNCLRLRLDPTRNDEATPDSEIQSQDSDIGVLVIHTREDLVMLREIRSALESG